MPNRVSILAVVVLAVLVSAVVAVRDAQAVFKGTLEDDAEFTIDIVGAGNNDGVVTITYLNGKGTKVRTMETVSVPTGSVLAVTRKIPKKSTKRIIIDVDPPAAGRFNVAVVQGPYQTNDIVDAPGARLVWDVVPGP